MMEELRGAPVVVTGGAGAIGSRLVRRLLELAPGSVAAVDDLSSGHRWLLPDDDAVRFHRLDVCDLDSARLEVERPWVFHLAAFFANQNSVDHPIEDLRRNGQGTLSTLLWAAARGGRRLVYASAGCSIAGHGVDAPIREEMPVSLDLDTPYQITKALGEFYCNYFADRLSTVRCRFFNSYGPGEVPGRYRNVIPNFVWAALRDRPLTITGSGDETRDFIFVDDLVDGLLRAAVTPAAHRGAFNLGTGVQTRIGDLAELIRDVCGSRSTIRFAPRRPWDNSAHRQADISRARTRLGFEPRVALREGLERTVEWFRAHRQQIEQSISDPSR